MASSAETWTVLCDLLPFGTHRVIRVAAGTRAVSVCVKPPTGEEPGQYLRFRLVHTTEDIEPAEGDALTVRGIFEGGYSQ